MTVAKPSRKDYSNDEKIHYVETGLQSYSATFGESFGKGAWS
jgi:hypothetical protein